MTLQEFTERWLQKHGMLDADSPYDGFIGTSAQEVVAVIAQQGHSGTSASILWTVLQSIFTEYTNPDSHIWREFFLSKEGIALQEQYAGKQFIYFENNEQGSTVIKEETHNG